LIIVWLVAIGFIAGGLFFLLALWRPKSADGSWKTIAGFKIVSLIPLSIGYLLLLYLLHAHWPLLGLHIAWTIIGAAAAAIFLDLAWYVVSSRRDLEKEARARLSGDSVAEEVAENALHDGPLGASEELVGEMVNVGLLRLPFGWLVMALLPVGAAALIGLCIYNMWATGSYIHSTVSHGHGNGNAPAVFEHVAYFAFFGGMLVVGLAQGLKERIDKAQPGSDWLLSVVASTVALGLYVAFEGAWP